jgi:predicted RNA-binding Zn-ribbon protein involved in translation (DUF1610 family)
MPKESEIDRLYGLEPVIDVGNGSVEGSGSLEQFAQVDCPYCGEEILVRADLSAGSQAYVEDCQVCCQPMTVSVSVGDHDSGAVVTVERV